MPHEQESTAAAPGITIQDFVFAWGRQEAPGHYFNAGDKAIWLLGEIRHAVRDGDLKILDPRLGRERSFRESDSPALDHGRAMVLLSSINAWLGSIGMTTLTAVDRTTKDRAVIHKAISRRNNILGAVIEKAKGLAVDPDDCSSVWASLSSLAESPDRPAPLYGFADGCVQYKGKHYEQTGVPDYFTKAALRKRMSPTARGRPQKPDCAR